jgi:hypothetical protein
MLFIPQEIKEKLAALEDDKKRLEAENNRLNQELASSKQENKPNILTWVFGVLLLASAVYIAYGLFYPKAVPPPQEEDLQAVIARDGNIEKWNRKDDGSLVYRVQLGAYEGFDLDAYKQNIEGLYQDSINGFKKISLGAFTRFKDAQEFQTQMVRLGLDNVYIVAYENNKPLGLIEASKKEEQNKPE